MVEVEPFVLGMYEINDDLILSFSVVVEECRDEVLHVAVPLAIVLDHFQISRSF